MMRSKFWFEWVFLWEMPKFWYNYFGWGSCDPCKQLGHRSLSVEKLKAWLHMVFERRGHVGNLSFRLVRNVCSRNTWYTIRLGYYPSSILQRETFWPGGTIRQRSMPQRSKLMLFPFRDWFHYFQGIYSLEIPCSGKLGFNPFGRILVLLIGLVPTHTRY